MDSDRSINAQKVLFFTDRIFWPANDGHKVVLCNYCKGLAEEYGCEIHVLSFLEPGQTARDAERIPSYVMSVELVDRPSILGIIRNILISILHGVNGGPIQCALFGSRKVEKQLQSLVEKVQPTHIFFDLPRLSSFVRCVQRYQGRKILYMEDLFSTRYKRQLKNLDIVRKTGGIAGKYSANLSGVLAKIASLKTFERALLRSESKRMKHLETNAPNVFDDVVLVSIYEVNELKKRTGMNNIISIPLGVDYSFFSSGIYPSARSNTLSFLGDMRSSANADSLRYIVSEILPKLKHDVVLEVSGTVDDALVQEFAENQRVLFLGRVKDTRVTLRSSQVFLAPVAYGTGIKTKILEAMAIGVPIITNSVGNEGIGLINGIEAFVSDDATELALYVDMLLDDRALSGRIAKSAQEKAKNEYDWNKSFTSFSLLGFSRRWQ